MMMQASFVKINNVLSNYIIVAHLLDSLLSIRAKHLYREILKSHLENPQKKLLLNYKYLEEKLGYRHNNIRRAFVELENQDLAYREAIEGTRSQYIQMNIGFFKERLAV